MGLNSNSEICRRTSRIVEVASGQEVTASNQDATNMERTRKCGRVVLVPRIMPGWLRGGGVNIPFIHPAKATEYVSVCGALSLFLCGSAFQKHPSINISHLAKMQGKQRLFPPSFRGGSFPFNFAFKTSSSLFPSLSPVSLFLPLPERRRDIKEP